MCVCVVTHKIKTKTYIYKQENSLSRKLKLLLYFSSSHLKYDEFCCCVRTTEMEFYLINKIINSYFIVIHHISLQGCYFFYYF